MGRPEEGPLGSPESHSDPQVSWEKKPFPPSSSRIVVIALPPPPLQTLTSSLALRVWEPLQYAYWGFQVCFGKGGNSFHFSNNFGLHS